MGALVQDLLRGYIESEGLKKLGPNWKEQRRLAGAQAQTAEQTAANMPTPEEASMAREASLESTRALSGVRGATAENLSSRTLLAQRQVELREAMQAYAQDPTNPKNVQAVALAKKAEADAKESLASAGLLEAKTENPAAFRNPPPQGTFQPFVSATGEITGFYNNRNPNRTMGVPDSFPEGARRTPLPAVEMEKRGLLESIISDADYLDQLAPNAEGSVGPFAGRWTAIKRAWLGGVEPDVNDLFHIADNLADMLLRARSGAQINEQEYRRLRMLVPDPRTPFDTFADNLRRFRIETSNILSARRGGPVSQTPLPSVIPRPAGAGTPTGAPPAGAPTPPSPGAPAMSPDELAVHTATGTPATPALSAPLTGMLVNKRTGERVMGYSIDGGKTWQPGTPPR